MIADVKPPIDELNNKLNSVEKKLDKLYDVFSSLHNILEAFVAFEITYSLRKDNNNDSLEVIDHIIHSKNKPFGELCQTIHALHEDLNKAQKTD